MWGLSSESNVLAGRVTKPQEQFLEEDLKIRWYSLLAQTVGTVGLGQDVSLKDLEPSTGDSIQVNKATTTTTPSSSWRGSELLHRSGFSPPALLLCLQGNCVVPFSFFLYFYLQLCSAARLLHRNQGGRCWEKGRLLQSRLSASAGQCRHRAGIAPGSHWCLHLQPTRGSPWKARSWNWSSSQSTGLSLLHPCAGHVVGPYLHVNPHGKPTRTETRHQPCGGP